MLEAELKQLIVEQGGIRPGVARREAFKDSPPSADMTYLQPWAESVVSFAMTVGTDWIEDYFGKVERMTMRDNMYHIYHNIYGVAEAAAAHLKRAGYKAHAVIPNGLYRPDHTFEKELPDQDILPPLSLRYLAVGAGVGVFGWSGNVMVPGHHSNVYLDAVLTDAKLTPDSLLEEDLCDGCRICASVCPVEFIDKEESVSVTIAGREFSHNKKRGDLRCVIGCGGYTGLAPSGYVEFLVHRPDPPARRSGRIARVVRPFVGRPGQRRRHQEPDLRNQGRSRPAQGEYQNDLQQLHHRLQRPAEAAQGA